jgi:hypothetical protein
MEQEQLTEFKIQLALPAPNIEIAQEVANKAQVLKSIWILSILKPGRLHAKESRCSFIWFKLNK